jgi:hypothetical protein
MWVEKEMDWYTRDLWNRGKWLHFLEWLPFSKFLFCCVNEWVVNISYHYRNLRLYRVSASLPSAFCRALGKEGFVECHTRQSSALGNEPLYRVQDTRHRTTLGKDMLPSVKHSTKKALGKGPSAAVLKLTTVSLCREPRTGTRQRGFFAECQILGTQQRRLCRVSSTNTR